LLVFAGFAVTKQQARLREAGDMFLFQDGFSGSRRRDAGIGRA
jgi:hypothetical protein